MEKNQKVKMTAARRSYTDTFLILTFRSAAGGFRRFDIPHFDEAYCASLRDTSGSVAG
jgi:hypothetical protein